MTPTDREQELAKGYIRGEYTEVQFNYLAHQCGSDRERMEKIVGDLSTTMPLATAVKFVLICMLLNFLACTLYSLAMFYRST